MQHSISSYKYWRECQKHFPKRSRHTLGNKIDNTFVGLIEWISIATYQTPDKKLPTLLKASAQIDLLKCFLQVAWEVRDLDEKKYITVSQQVNEVGRMLGAWIGKIQNPQKTTTAQKDG